MAAGFSLDQGQVVSSPEGAALAVGVGLTAVVASVVEAAHSVEEGLQETGDERTSEIGKILYCRRKRETEDCHP
jgi:hypothetical protein